MRRAEDAAAALRFATQCAHPRLKLMRRGAAASGSLRQNLFQLAVLDLLGGAGKAFLAVLRGLDQFVQHIDRVIAHE